MKNMTVKELKEILNNCSDDMPVIIPVIDIDNSNNKEKAWTFQFKEK